MLDGWQVEQKLGGRGRGREWATLGVHPLSWLLSTNRLEKVHFLSVPHTSANRLLLSNQDKGCTPSVAHSLAFPLGPTLLNLWIVFQPNLSSKSFALLLNSTRSAALHSCSRRGHLIRTWSIVCGSEPHSQVTSSFYNHLRIVYHKVGTPFSANFK